MTSPSASSYQSADAASSIFQPSIASSDSDYKDEKKAVAAYQQAYGTQGSNKFSAPTKNPYTDEKINNSGPGPTTDYPTLSMSYTTAPDLIPVPNTNGSNSGNPSSAPLPGFPVFIELATLMSTENSFLTATNDLADQYENTLVPVVRDAMNSGTIFGQIVGSASHNGPKVAMVFGDGPNMDPLDKEGTKFASKINPQMGKLLQSVGNVIESMGVFTALINKVGQYYTETDFQSSFPPPGLMEGPNPPTK